MAPSVAHELVLVAAILPPYVVAKKITLVANLDGNFQGLTCQDTISIGISCSEVGAKSIWIDNDNASLTKNLLFASPDVGIRKVRVKTWTIET